MAQTKVMLLFRFIKSFHIILWKSYNNHKLLRHLILQYLIDCCFHNVQYQTPHIRLWHEHIKKEYNRKDRQDRDLLWQSIGNYDRHWKMRWTKILLCNIWYTDPSENCYNGSLTYREHAVYSSRFVFKFRTDVTVYFYTNASL